MATDPSHAIHRSPKTSITISLFGAFEIMNRSQIDTTFRSSKGRLLLAYLLSAYGQPVLRTTLTELLWYGYPKRSALASLRQVVTDLRTLFAGTNLFQADYHTIQVQMDPAVLTCDVHLFEEIVESCKAHAHPSLAECPLCREHLTQALALYKGGFLETLPTVDSPPMNEWLQAQRMRYQEEAERISAVLQHSTRVQAQMPGNLPAPLTPLIGRADEVNTLTSKLLDPVYRCLTLTGPGGIGKTRLGLALGSKLETAFVDGIWFVDLGALAPVDATATEDTDAYQMQIHDLLATAMINALELTLQRGVRPTVQLLNYVQDKTILFILDNFEHFTDGVGLLTQILQKASALRFLVTSRHSLDLQGQQIYRVNGLAYPTESAVNLTDGEMMARYASLQLFLERAALTQMPLTLDAPTVAAVAEICRLVEGMPLALELAAALLKSQEIDAIAQMIQANYQILRSSYRDLLPRQRSVQAILRTDWQLLTPNEAQILARCAVFQGSFTTDAAQQVIGATRADLIALSHKSLLQQQSGMGNAPRHRLHELVRQFAAEQLAQQRTDQQTIAARHAAYYMALLQAQENALLTHADAQTFIQRELDNIRVAWQWSVAQGDLTLLAQGATSLFTFYRLTGLYHEALQHLESAIARLRQIHTTTPADPTPLRLLARLLGYASDFYRRTGAIATSTGVAEEALALGQQLADPAVQACAYHLLARLAQVRNNLPAMQRWAEAGCTQARLAQRADLLSECLNDLGIPLTFQQQPMAGVPYFEEALQTVAGVANHYLEAQILANLGRIRLLNKEYELARRYLQRASFLHQTLRDQENRLATHLMLGDLWMAIGLYPAAQQEYGQAQALLKVTANPYWISWLQICAGYLHHLCGDSASARAGLTLGRQTAQQAGNHFFESCALFYLGYVLIDEAEWDAAQAYFEQSLALQTAAPWMMGTVDVQAGLAACLLTQGETTAAIYHVEKALHLLAQHGVDAAQELFWVYWLCFQVLQTVDDGRAQDLLRTAYERLQAHATQFEDPALRHAFLNDVAVNRRLILAAQAAGLHSA